MQILVSGSLAIDRIMTFDGRFGDHIVPERIHQINLSFTVDGFNAYFGGTAGNIAYSLSLLEEKPRIVAAIGYDYHRYFEWWQQRGIATDDIRIVAEEATASAYITTDLADNQITGFNPGAMKHPSGFDFGQIDPQDCIAIVAPGNLDDMTNYTRTHRELGIFTIFDPGQSLPAWAGEDLGRCISQSDILISNDYEFGLIKDRTGWTDAEALENAGTIITTRGEHGCLALRQDAPPVTVPAIPTANVVDPTGAGDAFRGGLVKGLIQGLPLERCVMMGTVCSHFVIQIQGTQKYHYTPEQYQATLDRHFGAS
jgi:adenosine kinase